MTTPITRDEYTVAKTLASEALFAFNHENEASLLAVVREALDNKQKAREMGRSSATLASWTALAHSSKCMARNSVESANMARRALHTYLEVARQEAKTS